VADSPSGLPWQAIDVDGEPFEWRVVDAKMSQSAGPSLARRQTASREVRLLCIRRPADDLHSFATVHEADERIDESSVRDAIRSCRETTAHAVDYRRHETAHALELAMYWGRLPFTAQQELAHSWLERCEQRIGKLPAIDDATDLREVSTKTLLAARRLGLAAGDDEEAAQKRDVRAAFEKHVGPV
jgi:hypothetical protein